MNKKGFTLVELLTTLSIMVLLGLVIGVNLTSILRSTEDQNKDFEETQIEKAACVFADSESANLSKKCMDNVTDCTSITIDDLINSGLLDDNEYSEKSGTITVTRNNGKKTCTYTE